MQALDLTDEQRKAVRGLMLNHRKETQKARIGLMTIRDEQKTMLMSGNIDLNKLADLDEQSVKLKSEIMRSKLKMKRERLKLLTPEQQEKLGDLIMNTRGRGGFGGPGRMRGGQRADAFIPGGLDSVEDI
jgi:Spy/CpxP family protein refolding chaperone